MPEIRFLMDLGVLYASNTSILLNKISFIRHIIDFNVKNRIKIYDRHRVHWSLFFQVKQRIIDVDTKNSLGLVGHIEKLSHNALAVYWNPLESPAKVNLAVQCLSTDFRWFRLKIDVNSNIPFQYTKRSKRSSTAHTNWHVRRSQIWCWSAAFSPRLFSSQNILRQRSWEEAQGRGATCSEASYDAQWEAKTGRDVPWIFRKVRRDSFIGQGWRGEW